MQLSLFDNNNFGIYKKLQNYTMEQYITDIKTIGLQNTWENICNYLIHSKNNDDFLNINNFDVLYETALALIDKQSKKNSGKYATPKDVAAVMGKWLKELDCYNICDVGCGTGNLILTYLDSIGEEEAKKIISEGRIYLYDIDKVALNICKKSILAKFRYTDEDKINAICCDFLNKNIQLPENSKIISNPPYASISNINETWDNTEFIREAKELYSSFMYKIIAQSEAAVIITPFSFISGDKYKSLRKQMSNRGNGFIVSFDNVPGNIFYGKKHGIFNTNTANSVRAAITVFKHDKETKGFKVSPLIRFKNAERTKLLNNTVLKNTLPDKLQITDDKNSSFKKISKNLINIFDNWQKNSDCKVKDIITQEKTNYFIDMPNTCRYYTTASHRKLKRAGSITSCLKDEKSFYFLYCFINSSFAYWWWRIFDGGITYPVSLFNEIPLPFLKLSDEDFSFFKTVCEEMKEKEAKYIIKKINAGEEQENIRFPNNYRDILNKRILEIIGCDDKASIFDEIHSNTFFRQKGVL